MLTQEDLTCKLHIQQVTQQEKIKKINGLFDGLNSPFFAVKEIKVN